MNQQTVPTLSALLIPRITSRGGLVHTGFMMPASQGASFRRRCAPACGRSDPSVSQFDAPSQAAAMRPAQRTVPPPPPPLRLLQLLLLPSLTSSPSHRVTPVIAHTLSTSQMLASSVIFVS